MLKKTVAACALLFVSLGSLPVWAEYGLNLTKGVTPISKEVYDLHMLILYIVTIIAVLVFGVLFYSIYHHRKSKGAVPAKFHHNTRLEIIWTVIPILILVGMAVPATKTLIKMEKTENADITVKITGYQWKWRYDYMEDGFGFFSNLAPESNKARQLGANQEDQIAQMENYLLEVDKPLVLPVKTKIRLLTTAEDVIHAWWVPALGWKRDAIPGYINDNWTYIEEPGVYRGQCTELCGRDHAFMPVVVHAVSQAEYATWVEEQQSQAEVGLCADESACTTEELMGAGERLYGEQCAQCHQAQGQGLGEMFPALVGSALVTGPAADHIQIVLHGKNLMPAFAGQLSDAELAAIITYERNAWGNDVGDEVQPADVAAAR